MDWLVEFVVRVADRLLRRVPPLRFDPTCGCCASGAMPAWRYSSATGRTDCAHCNHLPGEHRRAS